MVSEFISVVPSFNHYYKIFILSTPRNFSNDWQTNRNNKNTLQTNCTNTMFRHIQGHHANSPSTRIMKHEWVSHLVIQVFHLFCDTKYHTFIPWSFFITELRQISRVSFMLYVFFVIHKKMSSDLFTTFLL